MHNLVKRTVSGWLTISRPNLLNILRAWIRPGDDIASIHCGVVVKHYQLASIYLSTRLFPAGITEQVINVLKLWLIVLGLVKDPGSS